MISLSPPSANLWTSPVRRRPVGFSRLLKLPLFFAACMAFAGVAFGDSKPPKKITFSIPEPAIPMTVVAEDSLVPVETTPVAAASPITVGSSSTYPRGVASWLEVQIGLARRGFSGGAIDGIRGLQSSAALQAFQNFNDLPSTGELDPATRDVLLLDKPPLTVMTLEAADLAGLQPLASTWLGKSQQATLAYETALEMVSERTHAHPNLIKALNPSVDWSAVHAGTVLTVPAIDKVILRSKAARLRVLLSDRVLEAFDDTGLLLAHFPVSIARNVEKRPVGELHVTVVIPNPDYTFDPENFPESDEGRELGRRLILPPGPNNPVGVAWIGLDRPGYGIHGTPGPEQIGRTESHGCFRLANWDAVTLITLAWNGLPVVVAP